MCGLLMKNFRMTQPHSSHATHIMPRLGNETKDAYYARLLAIDDADAFKLDDEDFAARDKAITAKAVADEKRKADERQKLRAAAKKAAEEKAEAEKKERERQEEEERVNAKKRADDEQKKRKAEEEGATDGGPKGKG